MYLLDTINTFEAEYVLYTIKNYLASRASLLGKR